MPSYLVIGGNGFLGQHVQEQIRLVKDASTITVFDLSRPKHPEPDVRYVVGDLRNYQDVYDALEGITAVIHTASPPPVDSDHPPRDLYFDINVKGTLNVIKACQERGIKVLVVTSSGSVISTGEEMVNVDEDTPYPSKAIDVYTESKIECEKQVLNANGVKGLLTCTLRPSAIFGPRDPLMIPGMIQICRNGQHRYQTGNNQSLMDFTYVGNIAYAHVLAAQKLATPGSGAAGQAFNVTNGTPIPFWDFASRVWATYGYYMPNHKKIILSKQTSFTIASIQEKMYRFKLLFWDESQVKKSLSKARLKQAMASRYFNIEKARTLLGYEPQVSLDEGIKLSVAWYKEQYPQ